MKSKSNFHPVNLHLTTCEDLFTDQGTLISNLGILKKENRTLKQNRRMEPKFSKRERFEN